MQIAPAGLLWLKPRGRTSLGGEDSLYRADANLKRARDLELARCRLLRVTVSIMPRPPTRRESPARLMLSINCMIRIDLLQPVQIGVAI